MPDIHCRKVTSIPLTISSNRPEGSCQLDSNRWVPGRGEYPGNRCQGISVSIHFSIAKEKVGVKDRTARIAENPGPATGSVFRNDSIG